MTKNQITKMGKVSHFITQVFRYVTIFAILTFMLREKMSRGTELLLTIIIYYEFLKFATSADISIHKVLLDFIEQRVSVDDAKRKLKEKFIGNILAFIALIFFLWALTIFMYTYRDNFVFFYTLLIIFFILLLYQFLYFKLASNFVTKVDNQ